MVLSFRRRRGRADTQSVPGAAEDLMAAERS